VSQEIERLARIGDLATRPPVWDDAGGAAPGSWDIGAALGRRWRLAAALVIPCAIVLCGIIWTAVKAKYEAVAKIRVSPIVPRIMYETEESRPLPLYTSFLNTQAQLLLSGNVLAAANEQPTVRELPRMVRAVDPIGALADTVEVGLIRHTQLIQVRMVSTDPSEVAVVVNAVVDAYMDLVGKSESQQENKTIASLEREREALTGKRRQLAEAIRASAEEFGTTVVYDRQNANLEGIQKIITASAEAEIEQLRLRARLSQLEEGRLSDVPAEQLGVRRDQHVTGDPVVQSLARQLAEAVAGRRTRLAGGLTQEHSFVKALEKQIDGLRRDYADEKARASKQFDRQLQSRQAEYGAATQRRLQQELESAKQLQRSLAEVLKAKDLESSSMGRKGLAIQTLQEELDAAKEEYERVSQRLRQMEMERGRPGRISVASYAATPTRPTVDKRYKFTAVALMASVFLAVGVALGIDRLDRRVQLPVDVAGPGHLRVLGTVPRLKDLKTGRVDREEFVEAYRVIRNYILQSANGKMPQSLAVTSACSGEGKTGVAASLATSFTETGQRVLLIDGDIRKPDVGQLFKLPRHERLGRALLAKKPLEELVVASVVPNLDVLPTSPGNGWVTRLLTPKRATRLIEEANRVYDVIIVDCPPVLAVADALVWAGAVDAVICTALAHRSDRGAVWAAHRRLLEAKANVIGAVIGNMPRSAAYYAYGYSAGAYGREDGHRRKGGRQPDALPLLITPGHEAENAPTSDQAATER